MKIKTEGGVLDVPAVWLDQKNSDDPSTWAVKGIDQTKLPFLVEFFECKRAADIPDIIKRMVVRGAPTIGATAALGLVLAVRDIVATSSKREDALNALTAVSRTFLESRPTAVDLKNGVETIISAIKEEKDVHEWLSIATHSASTFVRKIIEDGKNIGKHGEKLIKDGDKILTHCNAGPLAHVDHGSALAPIFQAKNNGKDVFTWVDETRPRLQGMKLTAWELSQNDVPHAIIPDNAAAFLMQKGEIDLIMVGADRVVTNGDVANKIGTYGLAVLAKEHDIPFYVAFPTSTLDLSLTSGKEIPIETRSVSEVTRIIGWDGERLTEVQVAPTSSTAVNYAFDVTVARYITAYVTPFGVFSSIDEVLKAFKDQEGS